MSDVPSVSSRLRNTSAMPDDYKRPEWRAEQLVDGEWVEIADYQDLGLVRDFSGARLMRGDREVGGPWRLFIDGELVATWNPEWGQGKL